MQSSDEAIGLLVFPVFLAGFGGGILLMIVRWLRIGRVPSRRVGSDVYFDRATYPFTFWFNIIAGAILGICCLSAGIALCIDYFYR